MQGKKLTFKIVRFLIVLSCTGFLRAGIVAASEEMHCEPSDTGGGYDVGKVNFSFCPALDLQPSHFIENVREEKWHVWKKALDRVIEQLDKDELVPESAKKKIKKHLEVSGVGIDQSCKDKNRLAIDDWKPKEPAGQIPGAGADDDDDDGQAGSDPDYGKCAWIVFQASKNKLCAPDRNAHTNWNKEQVDRVAGYIVLIGNILVHLSKDCLEQGRKDLKRYNEQWNNYALGGYTQFVWEYLINSSIRERRLEDKENSDAIWQPLRGQLILLHPSIGIGLDGASKIDDGDPSRRSVAVLSLEIIGGIGYFHDYKLYFGASALVTANNVDVTLPSVGVAIHLFRYIALGYSLGIVEDNLGRGTAFVLFDVGSLISGDRRIEQYATKILSEFE